MSNLADLQQQFLARLYAPETERDRMAIYHNNVYATLTHCLKNVYSVTHQLLGDDCFTQIAEHYISATPQHTGNRNRYGAEFFQALAEHPATHQDLYFQDVARLEWAIFQAHIAEDARIFTAENINTALTQSVFLHPSATLLSLNCNALDIWQAHQQCPLEDITLDYNFYPLLLWRNPDEELIFIRLNTSDNPGLAYFIDACLAETSLEAALSETLNHLQSQAQLQTPSQLQSQPQLQAQQAKFQQAFSVLLGNGFFTQYEFSSHHTATRS